MTCANLYDWARQSTQHAAYSRRFYPTAYRTTQQAPTYGRFVELVQAFSPEEHYAYIQEHNAWWQGFGEVWDKMGCAQEFGVGELTNQAAFRTAGATRAYGCMSCGTAGFGAFDQSIRDEDLDIEIDPYLNYNDQSIEVRPPGLPAGYAFCGNPPSQSGPTGGWEKNVNGWQMQVWASADNLKYAKFWHRDTNEVRWGCPKSNAPSSLDVSDVKKIQTALKAKGYNIGSTGVDGKVGPNTCNAAYTAKQDLTGDVKADLTPTFFNAIGVKEGPVQVRQMRMCAMHFKNWKPKGPTTPPKVSPPASPPLPPGYTWCTKPAGLVQSGAQSVVGLWAQVPWKDASGAIHYAYTHAPSSTTIWACPAKKTEPAKKPPEEPKKAGFGWILAIILGGTAVGMIVRSKMKKGKGHK